MFLAPVLILFAGAVLVFAAGLLKMRRTVLTVISVSCAFSASFTLVPFLFFSQPRMIGYFRGLLLFRIEPVASVGALFLSLSAAGFSVWLAEYYHGSELCPVLSLMLAGMSFSAASVYAANLPSMILFTSLTFLTLLFLRRKIRKM
jgi:hypothetical protein